MPIANTPKVTPKPIVSIGKDTTVHQAVQAMSERKTGAAVVQDGIKLVGVFTERDVLTRVVLPGLEPKTTPIADVMTRQVVTVREDTDRSTVLKLMTDHHIRHLPVVDREGRVLTMLSMRQLLHAEVNDLQQTVWELIAETAVDGPGG